MSEELPLAGRVAIVTGGGRGLGRAMTLGLARAGAASWRPRRASAAKSNASPPKRAAPGRIVPVVADVTEEEDCARVVADGARPFRPPRHSGQQCRPRHEIRQRKLHDQADAVLGNAPDAWRLVIDTNVVGPFLMARAAVPAMLAAGLGRIVNISMNAETMRRRGFSPYGPSKAALELETIIWAQDLAGTGVTVNALLPGGATPTGMIPASFPAPLRAKLLDPAIMVPPLLYLASTQSDGVTGRRFTAANWRDDNPSGGGGAGW